MKTKPYYLEFYKECMLSGRIPATGLCWCRGLNGVSIMGPEGAGGYWGFNGEIIYTEDIHAACEKFGVTGSDIRYAFTPLRQTIVLFMAAMNNEL